MSTDTPQVPDDETRAHTTDPAEGGTAGRSAGEHGRAPARQRAGRGGGHPDA